MRKTSARYVFFGILLLAALVRMVGIGYGLPLDLVPDESALIVGAITMLKLRTLIPTLHPEAFAMLYYPPLICYLYVLVFVPVLLMQFLVGGFHSLSAFHTYLAAHPDSVWLTARMVHVVLGTATVWLVGKIGWRLGGPRLGCAAAAFLALSFTHVLLSHVGKQWVVAVFFMTLVGGWSLTWPLTWRRMAIIGVCAGLAFGANLAGMFAWLIVVEIWFYRQRQQGKLVRLTDSRLLIGTGVCVFVAGMVVALHWGYFQWLFTTAMIGGTHITWHQSKHVLQYVNAFGYMIWVLLKYEPLMTCCAVIGMIRLVHERRSAAVVGFVVFTCAYVTYLYFCVHFESRYIALLLPALALFAGSGLSTVIAAVRAPMTRWIPLAVGMLFAVNMLWIARLDWLLLQPDTRQLARTWIETHADRACFLLSSGTSGVQVQRTQEAIELQDQYGSLRMGETERLRNPHPALNEHEVMALNVQDWQVEHQRLETINQIVLEQRRQGRSVYYLVNYWTPDTLSPLDQQVLERGRLVVRFENGVGNARVLHDMSIPLSMLFRLTRLGTTVEIYEISGVSMNAGERARGRTE